MKKFAFIIVLFTILSIVGYSQEKIEDERVLTQTEQIIDRYLEKTGAAIESLAETLKVPAERVYSILVKQQSVIGFSQLLATILFLLLTIVFIVAYNNSWRDEYDGWAIAAIFAGLIFVTILIIFICDGLPKLINPEYYAIKTIITIL